MMKSDGAAPFSVPACLSPGLMITLYHHPFCPHSRFIRLVLGEMGIEPRLVEEKAWDRRREFLLMAPEGATPVMLDDETPRLSGAEVIAEYLDETRGLALGDRRLMPQDPLARAETRRLMHWFNVKLFNESSQWLVREKVYKRFMSMAQGGGAPDMEAVRAARANLRYHLRYIGHLIGGRNWLAGDRLTYADLAAAAHLSCIDYLGDAPVGRERNRQDLVRANEVAPVVPPAAGRAAAGDDSKRRLRRSRLLTSLREKARALGFDACRVTSAEPPAEARERLAAWLAEGAHGDMAWMAETFERRADPRKLMADARSIVMLGLNYGPAADPLAALARPDAGAISVYARHRDYHDVIKGKLKELAAFLVAAARPEKADVKVFVDTAPLLEKPLAARAGLGWQGKHTNLVSREFGSWLFLGAILTNLELPPDPPESDHCGQCRACLDVCPTGAFPAPYQLDARRCISYLTIEHQGPIPRELRPANRQSHLWLRRLPCRLPVEQVRERRAGSETCRARGSQRAAPR